LHLLGEEACVCVMKNATSSTRTTATPDGRLTARVQTTLNPQGTPTPEILVTLPSEWPHRRLKAMLYGLAMDAEIMTPNGEAWITEVQVIEERKGRMYLELAVGNVAEAERGHALLQEVLQRQLDFLDEA